ncbi:adhesion G-protein coupled receptor G7-like [Colossoma macropomum]|uniref:adhesion G-protein coupled receptor G7-like n=1 Tax=Colossoma macropomum TaxID=42526 RepID=UPI00186568C2|nr:adhesion G-protein coupled receptor G7-like [Colossoma macropomum]
MPVATTPVIMTTPVTTTTPVATTPVTTTMPVATTTPVTTTTPATTTTPSTSSPTTNTATTRPSTLECKNNGSLQNYASTEFCLCPDEYTGKSCEIPNFCPESTVEGLTFPKTVFGQFSYSTEQCEAGTQNANLPKATAHCTNGTFDKLQRLQCSLTLDMINVNLSSASQADRQLLASNTQILTSIPSTLTEQNISAAAQIASRLLSTTGITEDIELAAVTTVSQLLNANDSQFSTTTVNSTNKYG